ncbi:MAG: peptidase [Geminicoccaceae bacterium]|nr:peptidase [Geminicoccaceae bacterium]
MTMSAHEAGLLDWLEQQQEPMVELLGRLVNTDSGSFDREGVARAGEVIESHFRERGLPLELIAQADGSVSIKATVAARQPGASNAHVLLLGHRDTVFPKGTAAERPFEVVDGRAYGPGVADMKAGLVMNAFVLEAFARAGGARRPLVGLFTSDEEIASPASRPTIEAAARGARAVFNAEPGRPSGNIVSGRKGAMFLTVEVTGKPAHSGSSHEHGVSAIEELCRKVQALHALTDYQTGTTVNVGLIEGGQSINTVAPWATAKVDVRFKTMARMAEAEAAIERVLAQTHLAGTTTEITAKAAFLPLEPSAASQALFEHYVAAAADLGMTIGGEYTGGSADSGFTAAIGAPTLCGTGPIGEKAHSPDEVCHLDSLIPRASSERNVDLWRSSILVGKSQNGEEAEASSRSEAARSDEPQSEGRLADRAARDRRQSARRQREEGSRQPCCLRAPEQPACPFCPRAPADQAGLRATVGGADLSCGGAQRRGALKRRQ